MSEDLELTRSEAEALRLLTRELRDAAPPELDWDEVEAEVMRRTELERAARRRTRPHSSWGSLAAFAAAAAAVVMMIAGTSQQNVVVDREAPAPAMVNVAALPTLPAQPDTLPSYRVDALRPHSLIVSQAEPVQLALEGVVTWTLDPNSRAIVRATGTPHVVELEAGSLHAEVVPRRDSDSIMEAFVVEVDGMRVAVHGTVFSVTRINDLVDVEVTRGTVTVGPASYRGATTGLLLSGPARARFDAATGAFVKRLPIETKDAADADSTAMVPKSVVDPAVPSGDLDDGDEPAADDGRTTSPPRASAAPGTSAEPPPEDDDAKKDTASDEPVAISSGQAAAMVSACVRQSEKSESGGVSSQATVHLNADGEVLSVQFNPPLNPKYQSACGAVLFGKRIEGSGTVSFTVSSK